jgi:hypothetical protein
VVGCTKDCDPDGESGQGIPAMAREVLAAALDIAVTMAPERPSPSLDGGWFTITVMARNPSPEPVWVRLPGDQTFGYVPLNGSYDGDRVNSGEPRWAFRAGETRRYVFDVNWEPGTYQLDSWFAGQHAPRITVTVQP